MRRTKNRENRARGSVHTSAEARSVELFERLKQNEAKVVERPCGVKLVATPLVSSDKPRLIREGLGKYEPNMPDYLRHLD